MDPGERLKELRAELADMTARIETVRAETLPQATCALGDEERDSLSSPWRESAMWILFVLGWY